MGEKARDFLKKNIGYMVVGLVSAIYIATSVITMGKTGKTFGEIMADGAVVLFLGVFVNRIFDLQGMMNGDREERVQETIRLHGEAVVRVSPYLDCLDKWCEEKNEEALKMQRTKILASEGMRYDDYFDEKGGAKPFVVNKDRLKDKFLRGDEIKRLRCFRKALRLKLTPLTARNKTRIISAGQNRNMSEGRRFPMLLQKSSLLVCSVITARNSSRISAMRT